MTKEENLLELGWKKRRCGEATTYSAPEKLWENRPNGFTSDNAFKIQSIFAETEEEQVHYDYVRELFGVED